MYKLNKICGFVALPIIIGSAILAVGVLGGLAYEYKDKLSFSGVDKNNLLAQVSEVITPLISYIAPTSASVGDTVTVYGSGFDSNTTVYLTLTGFQIPAVTTFISSNSLSFIIPSSSDINTGSISLLVGEGAVKGSGAISPSNSVSLYIIESVHSITVTSPNGGETYNVGDTMHITWRTSADWTTIIPRPLCEIGLRTANTINVVKYLTGDNNSALVDCTLNHYDWVIPSDIPTGNYLIDIVRNSEGADNFSNSFSISNSVSQPTFSCSDVQNNPDMGVYMQLCKSWVNYDVSKDLPSNNAVPDNSVLNTNHYTGFNNYKIYQGCSPTNDVSLMAGYGPYTWCSLDDITSYKLLEPSGGETLQAGQTYQIQWTPGTIKNIAHIYLSQYGTYNGVTRLIAVADTSGTYNWVVPLDLPGGSYKLLIGFLKVGSFIPELNNWFTIDNSNVAAQSAQFVCDATAKSITDAVGCNNIDQVQFGVVYNACCTSAYKPVTETSTPEEKIAAGNALLVMLNDDLADGVISDTEKTNLLIALNSYLK